MTIQMEKYSEIIFKQDETHSLDLLKIQNLSNAIDQYKQAKSPKKRHKKRTSTGVQGDDDGTNVSVVLSVVAPSTQPTQAFGRSFNVNDTDRTSYHYSPPKNVLPRQSKRESTPIANALERSLSSPERYRKEVIRQVLQLSSVTVMDDVEGKGGEGEKENENENDKGDVTWSWSTELAILIGAEIQPESPLSREETTALVLSWWSQIKVLNPEEWLSNRKKTNATATLVLTTERETETTLTVPTPLTQPTALQSSTTENNTGTVAPSTDADLSSAHSSSSNEIAMCTIAQSTKLEANFSSQPPSPPAMLPPMPTEKEQFGSSPFMWASRKRSERIRRLQDRGIYDTSNLNLRPPGPAYSIHYPSTTKSPAAAVPAAAVPPAAAAASKS